MNGDEKQSKKARLIETLRGKLGIQRRKKKQFDSSSDEADDKEVDQLTTAMGRYGNRNAKKMKRKIGIGWLTANWNGHCSRQVRKKLEAEQEKRILANVAQKRTFVKLKKICFFLMVSHVMVQKITSYLM